MVETVKDTRTMINMCLSCDQPECTGLCPKIEDMALKNAKSATKRRPPKMYTMDGETHTLRYWAFIYDLSPRVLLLRLKAGYDLKDALMHHDRIGPKGTLYTAFGITQTLKEWAEMCGKAKESLRYRVKQGMPLEEAFREAKKMCEMR